MRHIPLDILLKEMLADPLGRKNSPRLAKALAKVTKMAPGLRQRQIRTNGPDKWTPVKVWLTKRLGKKCWYTEAELVGAPLSIDHYRPVSKYWWLAFTVENYRVACPFSNSPEHNALHGAAGGKGNEFPLLPPARQPNWRTRNRPERPVILDPCNERDCDMIAFEADGRPVLNPRWASDPIACKRFKESLILLNLDHHDFNTKREQLGINVTGEVMTIEALPPGSPARDFNLEKLADRLSARAPFSSAAKHYLQFYRYLPWVQDLLNKVK